MTKETLGSDCHGRSHLIRVEAQRQEPVPESEYVFPASGTNRQS